MTTVPDYQVTDQPQLDLAECQWWIEFLHGDSPGLVHISGAGEWKGKSFQVDQMDQIHAYIKNLDERQVSGIYLRACTLSRVPRDDGRGSEYDSLSFPGFWADIDLAGPGHKTTNTLPPDYSVARQIVAESGLPRPSMWIHSGGGLYPWWILRHPVELTETDIKLTTYPTNFELIKWMSQQWQDVLAAAASRLGYHYGTGTGDLARVLRLPGTVNRKVPGAPTQCHILDQEGAAYTFEQLIEALDVAIKRMGRLTPEPMKTEQVQAGPTSFSEPGLGLSPFDDFEIKANWADILEPHGWRESHRMSGTRYWVRPGKNPRDGHSATTGHDAMRDRLYVFSTETPFTPGACYTKPAAYAVLNHHGDMKLAARTLKQQGYGTTHVPEKPITYPPPVHGTAPVSVYGDYRLTEDGAARRLVDMAGHNYRFVQREKKWYHFTGTHWAHDEMFALHREVKQVSDAVLAEADACPDAARRKELLKHGLGLQSNAKVESVVKQLRTIEGMAVLPDTFNSKIHLLNLRNGTLNLNTWQLQPHKPGDMLTKQMNASYDPDAKCPEWEAFIRRAFPDADMREYLQRALGYSILGEADQRAIFILNGPSGTGKSQLTRTMELVSGSYGRSAAAATFKQKKGESITNDLHDLRGARFVSTSETSAGALLDEELIKRVTGNDTITSRNLYEENQSWRPQCVIWMATNHMPPTNSDDNAMFRRIKPIDMLVPIGEDEEIGAFAERVLIQEADGILNWLLEGVRRYREVGLAEPEALRRRIDRFRNESDNVAQFIEDATEEDIIKVDVPSSISTMQLYGMYKEWCSRNGSPPLGMRRLKMRMERIGYEHYRAKGQSVWKGLGEGSRGKLGTMFT